MWTRLTCGTAPWGSLTHELQPLGCDLREEVVCQSVLVCTCARMLVCILFGPVLLESNITTDRIIWSLFQPNLDYRSVTFLFLEQFI